MIVVDPRFTLHRCQGRRVRAHPLGTDLFPFLFGLVYHIFKNGWETRSTSTTVSTAWKKVRDEVMAKWTPDKVEEGLRRQGRPDVQVAKMLADSRPGTIVWCMGQT